MIEAWARWAQQFCSSLSLSLKFTQKFNSFSIEKACRRRQFWPQAAFDIHFFVISLIIFLRFECEFGHLLLAYKSWIINSAAKTSSKMSNLCEVSMFSCVMDRNTNLIICRQSGNKTKRLNSKMASNATRVDLYVYCWFAYWLVIRRNKKMKSKLVWSLHHLFNRCEWS